MATVSQIGTPALNYVDSYDYTPGSSGSTISIDKTNYYQSYWRNPITSEKVVDHRFNDMFLDTCLKAVDKGIITTEQAFNLLRMIKSNDEESKELAKAILENAEAK